MANVLWYNWKAEGPLTEDPSTKEDHYENGRVFATGATIKIKHFRKGTHSNGKNYMFFATVADSKKAASDNCKTTLGTREEKQQKLNLSLLLGGVLIGWVLWALVEGHASAKCREIAMGALL